MITKEEFVKIINRLKETDDIQRKINKIFKNSTESQISDCMNCGQVMICHEDIVVKILEKIFDDTDMISYWLYELDYGRKYESGCVIDKNGDVDISTPDKLYDFLMRDKNEKKN